MAQFFELLTQHGIVATRDLQRVVAIAERVEAERGKSDLTQSSLLYACVAIGKPAADLLSKPGFNQSLEVSIPEVRIVEVVLHCVRR